MAQAKKGTQGTAKATKTATRVEYVPDPLGSVSSTTKAQLCFNMVRYLEDELDRMVNLLEDVGAVSGRISQGVDSDPVERHLTPYDVLVEMPAELDRLQARLSGLQNEIYERMIEQ